MSVLMFPGALLHLPGVALFESATLFPLTLAMRAFQAEAAAVRDQD